VNRAGVVVGNGTNGEWVCHSSCFATFHAFIHRGDAMEDLNDLIPEGYELFAATSINDRGQIVATGKGPEGDNRALLLTPVHPLPTVTLEGPSAVDEGDSLTLTAVATDPAGGGLVYAWDLDGDGTYEAPDDDGVIELDPTGDDGPTSRTIGVRVEDREGSRASATATVQIRNAPPAANLAASPDTLYTNGTATLAFSGAFDPAAADVAAGFSYSYDCAGDGTFDAPASETALHECLYAVAGTYPARARIEDKDGGFREYTVSVSVRTPEEGIAGLIETVQGFGLDKGIENSFVVKLEHAIASLEAGDPGAACAELQAFINHARAQAGNKLAPGEALQIIPSRGRETAPDARDRERTDSADNRPSTERHPPETPVPIPSIAGSSLRRPRAFSSRSFRTAPYSAPGTGSL
jgi:hypothetical protein